MSAQNVGDTVSDTMESIRDAIDLPQQVASYPWQMFAGAVVLGYIGGRYLQSDSEITEQGNHAGFRAIAVHSPPAASIPGGRNVTASPPSWKDTLSETFGADFSRLRALAIGTSLGLVRDMISETAPQSLRTQIAEIVDGVTRKLGGEPVISGTRRG